MAGLNRDHVRPVLRAGPQPRSCEASVACRTSTAIMCGQCSAPGLNRYVRRYVMRNVKKIKKICQKECQKICQKECQKICQKECQKICQKECQNICQKICQKECLVSENASSGALLCLCHVGSNTSDRRCCYVFILFAQTFLTGGLLTCFGRFDFRKCFRWHTAMFMFWHVCCPKMLRSRTDMFVSCFLKHV